MSTLLKKVVAGFSTATLVAMSLIVPATSVAAASAGGVYKTTDGTVWFVTSDMQKRPFTSAGAFLSYGFLSFSQVQEADASVTALPTGAFIAPQDGRIFCATATKGSDVSGECSLITGGQKAAFTSAAVFGSQGFSFSRAYYGDSSFLTKTSNIDNGSAQHRPGVLVNNNGTVQLIVNGGLWGVPSLDVFNSWGWSFADVVPANSADKLLSQIGIIPGRVAGQLVPTATASVTPTPSVNSDCTVGEGSVSNFDVGSPEETTVHEDQSDVELASFDVELSEDGCLSLNRFDLYMGELNGGTESSKPWDYFTDAHLLVNGDEVASMNVDSSSDWTEYNDDTLGTTSQEYRLRFSGIDATLAADETSTVSVSFDTVSNLDSADETATWQVGTETDSFRFTDATGFTFTDGEDLADSFDFEAADAAALDISASNDEPDARIIEVSDTADTNGEEIGAFDIENTENVDANITEIEVVLATGVEAEEDVLNKLYLYDGSDLVGQENVVGATVTFDNIDLDVNGDDTVTLTVKADFDDTNDQSRYADGETVEITDVNINELTDAMDNDENDITPTGTYASETFELRTEGIMLELADTDTSADTDASPDVGTFKIVFDVTAFGDDQSVTADCTGGLVAYTLTGTAGTDTCSVSSPGDAKTANGNYIVEEGQTRTFTLTVVDDGAGDFGQLTLDGIDYETDDGLDDATPDSTYDFNLDDFQTDDQYLSAT